MKKINIIIAAISIASFFSKSASAAETIYLAFGQPVPKVEIKCDADGSNITDRRVVGDFETSLTILETKANEIRDELARNFRRSGLVVSPDPDGPISGAVDIYLVTSFEPLPPYATVEVFFTNDNSCLEGIAYSAPLITDSDAHTSRYNQKLPGAFVNLYLAPVVASSATYVARLVAHEVGHTFGLKHIHPDDVDPGQSIMDNRKTDPYDALNACVTAVTPCTPSYYNRPLKEEGYWWHPFTWRHNPQYHARRWVGGESDQSLRDQCVYPGNWDLKSPDPPAVLQTNHRYEWFPNSGAGIDHPQGGMGAVYDFEVAIEEGRDSMRVVYWQDEVSLDQPLEFDLAVMRSTGFQIFAASAPGGERDIRLALDVPGDDPPVAARAFEDGTTQFELFKFLPNGAEPEPIAMVQVEARNEHVHSDGFESGPAATLEDPQGAPQQCYKPECRTTGRGSTYWAVQCDSEQGSYEEVLQIGANGLGDPRYALIEIRDNTGPLPLRSGAWAVGATGDLSTSTSLTYNGGGYVRRKIQWSLIADPNTSSTSLQVEKDAEFVRDLNGNVGRADSTFTDWSDIRNYTRVIINCRFSDGVLYEGIRVEQTITNGSSTSFNSSRIEAAACPTQDTLDSVNDLFLESSVIYQCLASEGKLFSDCSLIN